MAGELGWDTGPFVIAAAFCELVIKGDDGVFSLIRVIDTINVQAVGAEAPQEMPAGMMISTHFALVLRAGQAHGPQVLEVVMERPDGSRESSGERSFTFAGGENGGVNIHMPVQLRVETGGLYWADVLVNRRLVTRSPLVVNYTFTTRPG